MISIQDLRKKYLGAPEVPDEDLEIVRAVREYVEKEIMPCRRDLDGGWHRDEDLARSTFQKVHQGLVNIDVQRAIWPKDFGGINLSGDVFDLIIEEIARADAGLATHIGIIGWTMYPALRAGRMDLLQNFIPKICDDKPHGSCMSLTEPSGGANVEDPNLHGRTISTIAELDGKELLFLPRHGKNHAINPSNINYRANIYAMKALGVTKIISVSACGSLKEELKPLDFVIPDQFVDRTNQKRAYTFFDEGIVAHIGFAQPVCNSLAKVVHTAAQKAGVAVHLGGTYVNMEGPQFSTLAESNLYRSWGMDIIGMTNMAEARLAREAEICYVTLAAVTDYDCWHESAEAVTVEMILDNLRKNVDNSKKIIKLIISLIDEKEKCSCDEALKYAIVTQPDVIRSDVKKKLEPIISKYIK